MYRRKVFAIALFTIGLLLASVKTTAQTYTDLHDFDCATDGCSWEFPGLLAQGRDGNLYGTLSWVGAYGAGTVVKITPSGTVTTLYSFSGPDGDGPWGGLTLGSDGNFYGTTSTGGDYGYGTIFKITPVGTFTTLHSFDSADCEYPYSPPVQGKSGAFYGVTSSGCAYSITSSGAFKKLSTAVPFGSYSPLLLASDGNFYGTAWEGGANACGSVFRMSAAGVVNIIYSFDWTHGAFPYSPLVQGSDNLLYGVAVTAGANGGGVIFKMTTAGKITLLHQFDSSSLTDGYAPVAGLVAASDGNYYGSTDQGYSGGTARWGVLFKITKAGTYSVLYRFDQTHGATPYSTAVQHTNGNVYGATYEGGVGNGGVFYRLALGLKPFVLLLTTSGTAGQTVQILGTGLTGTTSVKFGTGSANFSVISDTYLTAVVPDAGTTGFVTVTAPSGTFTSQQQFNVVPVISSIAPTSGPVGTQVTITGAGFLGATKVSFGGVTASTFNVVDADHSTAIVPTGAKTGKIAVTTPGGSASSETTFTVTTPTSELLTVTLAGTGSGTVTSSPGGITCPGTCSAYFDSGAVVNLTESPASGSTFVGWSGACTGTGACSITMNASESVTATFNVSGPPIVTLSPASLSFGNVVINTTSAAKTVTLTNSGTGTLNISSIAPSGSFAISAKTCGTTLAAGAKCTVKVNFTPTVLGALTGALTFTDNAADSPQTVPLSGTGVVPATLTPATATYATQAEGTTSAAKTFTLTNNQTVALNNIVISTTGDFAVSATTCTTSLAAKAMCTISVTFTPSATGTRTGTLSVSDSANNSPQTVTLSGTGVAPATLTPATATYAAQTVGTTSAAKTFTLTNKQTVALNNIAISTTGDFAVSATTCTASLAAKGKCTISVTFTPTATGKRTGQLSAGDSASNSPQTSNLTGTGK